MNQTDLLKILEAVESGKLSPGAALERLRHLPFEDLGFAKVDHHRALRQGFAEVVFAKGKTPQQGAEIFRAMLQKKDSRHNIPVAEEAFLTAHMMGNRVDQLYDVGVAGIHRLLEHRESKLAQARVIICVAGMEGALPSVVGGLVAAPVIAVPTSVGYGASFGGIAALLGMLNSCASNVAVVNIDNGFGAACVASCINRQ